jgi:hypothetical protein
MDDIFDLDGSRDYADLEKEAQSITASLDILIHKRLEMERWGFVETYRNSSYHGGPILIFDNQWCRLEFTYDMERRREEDVLVLFYGRKHAANEKATIIWHGEECRCWYRHWWNIIYFLDGYTPLEAFKTEMAPAYIQEYTHSPAGRELSSKSQPEWALHLEVLIWQKYAPRLFELFDLEHPELWEKYYQFNKEIWKIRNRPPIKNDHFPTRDKIC